MNDALPPTTNAEAETGVTSVLEPTLPFVHLRVHSAYSLLQGAIKVKDLPALCVDNNMPAVAVTDTYNLFGAMEYSQVLSRAGIQPIVGCTLPLMLPATEENDANHATLTGDLVFLVQNRQGYQSLLKLLSCANRRAAGEATAHEAVFALTQEDLEQHSAGLIVLSGGPQGPIGITLLAGDEHRAETIMRTIADIFPTRLYVEIQRHGMAVERDTEAAFLRMAYAMNLPLVATNDVHFARDNLFEAHDVLMCISGNYTVETVERPRLTPHHYFKSEADMQRVFNDLPEAIRNTAIIAKRCAFMLEHVQPTLPKFDCADGTNEEETLRRMARDGLNERLQTHILPHKPDTEPVDSYTKTWWERLDFELDVIISMHYAGYFLIVADFIRWAKSQDIPVGPGRGSGAASVVAWSLKITELNPIQNNLIFERFLNPDRVSMPDFDIDFCQERRDEVIHYVQHKYGIDKVAQIITFGSLQPRAVLRDVARVLGIPYSRVDSICKLVPNNPANPLSLSESLAQSDELRQILRDDPQVARLFHLATPLEGLYRHASTHAAGVVIGNKPLDEIIPLYHDPRSDMPVTGFSMKYVEAAGLVKFDFLGLKTLTIIQHTIDMVNDSQNTDDPNGALDLAHMPVHDADTLAMIGRGETTGVFQLESIGMRDALRKLRPDCFEDIVAVVALYRPGPMDNIPSFIRRKHGEETISYLSPLLESVLKETYGIIVYQEQVIKIAQTMAGYTLSEADLLRRAMGKKIKAEMDRNKNLFIDGSVARGTARTVAQEVFELVYKFADYGFNKAHAAVYALVAWQTAYLKAHYAVEFLAVSMSLDRHNTDKIALFRQELHRLGIDVLPPDVNASQSLFSVESHGGKKAVRYALSALKNVGEAAMQALIEARNDAPEKTFTSLDDFIQRTVDAQINKRSLESLIYAGALDSIANGYSRGCLYENIDALLQHMTLYRKEKDTAQIGLFGEDSAVSTPPLALRETHSWDAIDTLSHEYEAIGFYLSAHPLDGYATALQAHNASTIQRVIAERHDCITWLGGTVLSKRERTSQRGKRFAFVQFSDTTGMYEVIVFAETLTRHRALLEVGTSLLLKIAVSFEGDTPRLSLHDARPLEGFAEKPTHPTADTSPTTYTLSPLHVIVDERVSLTRLHRLMAPPDVADTPRYPIRLVLQCAGEAVNFTLPEHYGISTDALRDLEALPGVLAIKPTSHSLERASNSA